MNERIWAIREPVLRALEAGLLASQAEALGLAKRAPASASRRGATAVVPLHGIITPRGSMLLEVFGATPGGLAGFRRTLEELAENQDVTRIVLDVDSPGGMVDGVPETAALIRGVRRSKRIEAVANTEAASAAYWLASQADAFYASPSALVGSVGVYATHVSTRRALEAGGVDVTLVQAGERKTDLHPALSLSEEGRAQLQALVDDAYDQFVRDVAAGRGVAQKTVRETYGGGAALSARAALAAGMVDGIATLDQVVAGAVPVAPAPRLSSGPDVGPELGAGPIAPHDTDVVDEPWDGSAQEAAIPNDAGARVLRRMYAWVDPDADPDTKAAYALPHHMVRDGEPREANVRAVRNALARLPQSRIPSSDHPGVQRHLRRHLEAFRRQQGMDGLTLTDELAWAACVLGGVGSVARLRGLSEEQRELLGVIAACLAEVREDPRGEDEEVRREVARALSHIAAL